MKDKLLEINRKHPLSFIIFAALIVRIIAMIFSKGFGFDSEHFYFVETPNAWLDNIDNTGYDSPRGISLFYVSINYLIFGFFKLFGIHNPQWLMFFSRLVHGIISLTVITLSYRITKILIDKRAALNVAWLAGFLWFMPYISVHNIAQAFSLPFLLYGTLLVIKQEKLRKELKSNNLHRTTFIIAGIFFALGFSTWYYSALFFLAMIIILIARKNFRGAVMSIIGFILTICVTLTIPDLIVWGRPFAEFQTFLNNNIDFSCPVGYYVIAILSILITIGYLTCNKNRKISAFNLKHKRLQRYICAFCFFINAVLLITTTLMYSNKPEVKAMTYLSKDENVDLFIIEDEFSNEMKRPPLFYEKKWSDYLIVNQQNRNEISVYNENADYVIFRENKDLARRVEEMKSYYPNLKHEVTYKPYFAQIMYKWLNRSKNDGCVSIYKVNHEH